MANGGLIDVGSGLAQTIGRYFSVVSVVPSSLYVIFAYVLITSGSWQHSPNWSHGVKSLEQLGVGGVAFLAFLSIAFGVLIHPIQFAIVQFFEGYWGTSPLPQAIRARRILHYQSVCEDLNDEQTRVQDHLNYWPKKRMTASAILAPLQSRLDEASRALEAFPRLDKQVMPTRLGNALRRAESNAGSQYSLDALQVIPQLLLIAPQGHIDYVNDQRAQLDLAVRMTFVSALACVTAVLFLWPYRFWVLVAVIPYALAYLSYRGSVVAAKLYGSALETLVHLDRFALYEQLRLRLPVDTDAERKTNELLTALFEYNPVGFDYQHPGAPDKAARRRRDYQPSSRRRSSLMPK